MIKAYRVTSAWEEINATWTVRNGSQPWSLSGGDYSSTELDSVSITGATTWYNFSIDNTLRGWLNGTYENYGIILIPASGTGNDNITEMYSSNYSAGHRRTGYRHT